MDFQRSVQTPSTSDRVISASLAAIAMFVVGYTATRAYLNQPIDQANQAPATVIPHQAALWSPLGR
ncbi:hypothetical protein C7271_08600 [filamentous cyanobacterium CCP5]|nr:hypothetical protein C7271_08600 [filamentous cyanobacterium CCP5]